ncbi:MAG: hypothetical protein ACYTBS_17350 [Planctomycetota bacterium]
MFALRKSICYLCFLALLVHAILSCSRSHADEKSFPAANDIFTIGMVSLDHIDKCGVNVLGWTGSFQRPEQRKWFARCVDFAKRHQMPVIMGLSIFNAEWKTYIQHTDNSGSRWRRTTWTSARRGSSPMRCRAHRA